MKKFILTIILVLTPLTAIAETLYVSDTLRVGVRTQPNNNVPSIAVVKSGMSVEVIKRKGSYIKVRTKSGIEGWVKSAYFSKKMPAARKLSDALKEIATLEKENKSLSKTEATKSSSASALNERINTLKETNANLTNQIQRLKDKPGFGFEAAPTSTKTDDPISKALTLANLNKEIIYITIGTLVVLFGLGFLFGISWHKGQIAKRLGGMSI